MYLFNLSVCLCYVCMYVCMFSLSVCVRVRIHVCAYVCAHIRACVYVCVYVWYTCVCLSVSVSVYVYPLLLASSSFNLKCFTTYSEFSDSVTYTCAAAAPEAPPTPECVDIGVRHVTVTWSSPDDNGGDCYCNTVTVVIILFTPAAITSYKLEMDDEDTVSYPKAKQS